MACATGTVFWGHVLQSSCEGNRGSFKIVGFYFYSSELKSADSWAHLEWTSAETTVISLAVIIGYILQSSTWSRSSRWVVDSFVVAISNLGPRVLLQKKICATPMGACHCHCGLLILQILRQHRNIYLLKSACAFWSANFIMKYLDLGSGTQFVFLQCYCFSRHDSWTC
jgi:hypothetical protein